MKKMAEIREAAFEYHGAISAMAKTIVQFMQLWLVAFSKKEL